MLDEIKNRISENLQNKEFVTNLYKRDSKDHKFYPLVVPFEDETFLSWIIRQSITLKKSPIQLLSDEIEYWNGILGSKLLFSKYLTPKITHHRIRQFLKWSNIVPLTDNFTNVLEERGISTPVKYQLIDDEITKIHDLQNYYRTYFPKNSFDMRKELVFCPQCFQEKENRYFKLKWLNPLYVICSKHKVHLKLRCSRCKVKLFDMKRILIKSSELNSSDFILCFNCGYNLIESEGKIEPQILILQDKVLKYNRINSNHSPKLKLIFDIDLMNENWKQYIQLVNYLNGVDDTDFNYYQITSNSIEFEFFKLEHLLWIKSVSGKELEIRSNLEINQGVSFQMTCYFKNCDFFAKLDTGQQRFGFKSHLLKSHLPSEIADKTCPKCGERMKANLINSHYTQKHQDRFNCTFCNPILEFETKIERDRHYRSFHRDFFCNKCKVDFEDFKEYHSHYVKTHKTLWRCGECPEVFSNNNEYRVHFRNNHKDSWGCSFCQIHFEDKTEYEKHYNYKHREYVCEECSIFFGKGKESKNEYRRHYEKLHKKEWKCGDCNEILSSDAEYTNHRRLKHPHPKKCNSCVVTLDNAKIYRHHRYIIHEKESQE